MANITKQAWSQPWMKHHPDGTEVVYINLEHVLVSYCHVANYHPFGGCNNTCSLAPASTGQKLGLSAQHSPRLKARCWPGWVLLWSSGGKFHFQAPLGYWPNSIPCSCSTEVCLSFLAVSQRLHSAPKYHPQYKPQGHLIFNGSNRESIVSLSHFKSPSGRALIPFKGQIRSDPAKIIIS